MWVKRTYLQQSNVTSGKENTAMIVAFESCMRTSPLHSEEIKVADKVKNV